MTTRFKEEDTPTLESTLEDIDDLGEAERVRLFVEHASAGLVVNKSTDDDDGPTIVDEATGELEYEFTMAETARPGRYDAEWVVEYPDGSQLSYPPRGYIRLRSSDALDRDADVEEIEVAPNARLTDLRLDRILANESESVGVGSDLDHEGHDIRGVGSLAGTGLAQRRVIDADQTLEVPEGHGSVVVGPLEGEGAVTGEGRLKVI